MKIHLNESDFTTNIILTPENMYEVAKLFRMTKHSKKEAPNIYLSFSKYNTDGVPSCSINLKKKAVSNQVNSTSNDSQN